MNSVISNELLSELAIGAGILVLALLVVIGVSVNHVFDLLSRHDAKHKQQPKG